jgi:hypothetical protein
MSHPDTPSPDMDSLNPDMDSLNPDMGSRKLAMGSPDTDSHKLAMGSPDMDSRQQVQGIGRTSGRGIGGRRCPGQRQGLRKVCDINACY